MHNRHICVTKQFFFFVYFLFLTAGVMSGLILFCRLGFLFGAGTAACVRKVNMNAAYAVGGVCVAAQVWNGKKRAFVLLLFYVFVRVVLSDMKSFLVIPPPLVNFLQTFFSLPSAVSFFSIRICAGDIPLRVCLM